jgi:integrase
MTTRGLRTTSDLEAAWIATGREALTTLLPDADFDAPVWNPGALVRTTASRGQRIYFTAHGSTAEPLPDRFGHPVKAWVVTGRVTPSRMNQRATAARWLWIALAERLGADAAWAFSWGDLQMADLQRAEQLMHERGMRASARYQAATSLGDLARQLGRAGVAPPLSFTPATPRPRSNDNPAVADLEELAEGVVTPAALAALADIFHHAQTWRDQFYSALMALLIATGLRWNEIVTLPVEPLEEVEHDASTPSGGRKRVTLTRIRRHKAKSKRGGGAGAKSIEYQWLTESQAELARLAVERLQALTAEARRVAVILQQSGRTWRWPGARPNDVGNEEIRELLACDQTNATIILNAIVAATPESRVPDERNAKYLRVRTNAFEAYMTARQEWSALEVVRARGGRAAQLASESLVCLRANEGHMTRPTLPLIDKVSNQKLERWLDGDVSEGQPGVFERFEQEYGVRFREPDGTRVTVNSHDCRRLFVTNGLRAGATTVDIARWQGREHVGDIAAYDKRSMADKVRAVKAAIGAGKLRGTVQQVYVQLADDVRDQWLEGQVQAMHVTPLGLCVHDFSAAPCPLALNCVKGCQDFLTDPGDASQRGHLVQLQRRTRTLLAEAESATAAGTPLAPSYVHDLQETDQHLTHILSADGAGNDGLVRPFADRETRHRPFGGSS